MEEDTVSCDFTAFIRILLLREVYDDQVSQWKCWPYFCQLIGYCSTSVSKISAQFKEICMWSCQHTLSYVFVWLHCLLCSFIMFYFWLDCKLSVDDSLSMPLCLYRFLYNRIKQSCSLSNPFTHVQWDIAVCFSDHLSSNRVFNFIWA